MQNICEKSGKYRIIGFKIVKYRIIRMKNLNYPNIERLLHPFLKSLCFLFWISNLKVKFFKNGIFYTSLPKVESVYRFIIPYEGRLGFGEIFYFHQFHKFIYGFIFGLGNYNCSDMETRENRKFIFPYRTIGFSIHCFINRVMKIS